MDDGRKQRIPNARYMPISQLAKSLLQNDIPKCVHDIEPDNYDPTSEKCIPVAMAGYYGGNGDDWMLAKEAGEGWDWKKTADDQFPCEAVVSRIIDGPPQGWEGRGNSLDNAEKRVGLLKYTPDRNAGSVWEKKHGDSDLWDSALEKTSEKCESLVKRFIRVPVNPKNDTFSTQMEFVNHYVDGINADGNLQGKLEWTRNAKFAVYVHGTQASALSSILQHSISGSPGHGVDGVWCRKAVGGLSAAQAAQFPGLHKFMDRLEADSPQFQMASQALADAFYWRFSQMEIQNTVCLEFMGPDTQETVWDQSNTLC